MRLVTRSDFDGIGCAALLFHLGLVDDWYFTHPKDMQEGKVKISSNDIIANVPYVEGCGMWFDHHVSEESRLKMDNIKFEGVSRAEKSATHLVWDYYGGEKRFPKRFTPIIEAVDKVDSADLTPEEALFPQGWIKLGFLADPRTGLGRIHTFRISNRELMDHLIRYITVFPVDELLNLPDVKERVEVYEEQTRKHEKMINACSRVDGKCCIIDLREQDPIYIGNRFYLYAMNPEVAVSIHIVWGMKKQNVVLNVGKSIFNRSSKVNIGNILLEYGGGGHAAVGTCQVAPDEVEDALKDIVGRINNG